MLLTSTMLAIAAVTMAAAGSYASMRAQSAAAKQQKDAQQTQLADQAAQRAQEIRDQYRQQRIKSAEIAQSAANTGTQYSSGEIGGTSAIGSTIANNIGSINRAGVTSNAIGRDQQNAANFMADASTYQAIGSLASSAAGMFSSFYRPNATLGAAKPNNGPISSSGGGNMWGGAPYAYGQNGN